MSINMQLSIICPASMSRSTSARVFKLHVCTDHECTSCLFTLRLQLTSAVTLFASVCQPTEKLISKTNEDFMILLTLNKRASHVDVAKRLWGEAFLLFLLTLLHFFGLYIYPSPLKCFSLTLPPA